jgi:hypothetical protein
MQQRVASKLMADKAQRERAVSESLNHYLDTIRAHRSAGETNEGLSAALGVIAKAAGRFAVVSILGYGHPDDVILALTHALARAI